MENENKFLCLLYLVCFQRVKKSQIVYHVNIALREWNRYAGGVQGVVDYFLSIAGVGDALGGQDVLLHYYVNTAVAKFSKHHIIRK